MKFDKLDFEKINTKLIEEKTANPNLAVVPVSFCQISADRMGGEGRHGVPFTYVGEDKIKRLVKLSKELKIRKPEIKEFKENPFPPASLSVLTKCWLPKNYLSTKYIGLDEFTNETLIAGIIDYTWETKKNKLPIVSARNFQPYVVHYSAALCGENTNLVVEGSDMTAVINKNVTGLNLMELCNMGNLKDLASYSEYFDKTNYDVGLTHPVFAGTGKFPKVLKGVRQEPILKENVARGVLFSVVYMFHFLHEHLSFVHGDAKVANVFLHKYSTESSAIWKVGGQNKEIKMPFCAKLADFGKSSATFLPLEEKDPIRLRWEPEQNYKRGFRNINSFTPKVTNDTYNTGTSITWTVYSRLRMMDIPYYKSYDVYMFMVSFFLQPWNFYLLHQEPKFKRAAWDPLWHHKPADGEITYSRIKEKIAEYYGKSELQGTGILIEILKDLTLACNITLPLLNALALYFNDSTTTR